MQNAEAIIKKHQALIAENRRLRQELDQRFDNLLKDDDDRPLKHYPDAFDFCWADYRATMQSLDSLFAECRRQQ